MKFVVADILALSGGLLAGIMCVKAMGNFWKGVSIAIAVTMLNYWAGVLST